MPNVVVVADHVGGAPTKPALELLTLARRLGTPVAVAFGPGAADAAPALGAYGATRVLGVVDPAVEQFLVVPRAEAVAQVAAAVEPVAVLLTASAEGKEVAARLAVKLAGGLITDVVDVAADGSVLKSDFAGSYTARAAVRRGPAVLAVKPNTVTPEQAPADGSYEEVAVTISEAARGARIVATEPRAASGRPGLGEAAIVVSGGRGTGGDFSEVEGLADALGGAVGASRAAVDSGWYPHAYQIGQTGLTVSPQLYVAAGISGAVQHRAGMQTSKAVVAVNSDPEAPIFALADLGVVGDLHAVLPAVTAEVARRKG